MLPCVYYNETRPHSALNWLTPAEFARQQRKGSESAVEKGPNFST